MKSALISILTSLALFSGPALPRSVHTVAVLPTGTPEAPVTHIPDLGVSIAHIEVNQAIQDDNDAVPLVANKAAVVRVYLNCSTGCGSSVSGSLHLRTSIGTFVPAPAWNHSVVVEHPASWTEQRGDLSKSLNYYMAPEFARGGWTTMTVFLDGNFATVKPVFFTPVRIPRVVVIPIDYRPPSVGLCSSYNPNTQNRGPFLADAWAGKLMPVPSLRKEVYPVMPFDLDLREAGDCDKPNPELIKSLKRAGLIATSGTPDAIYGWLPNGALGGGLTEGMYWVSGRFVRPPFPIVSFGDAGPESSRIFAHELAHTFLRPHTPKPTLSELFSCALDTAPPLDARWPYQDSKIHAWGVDLSASSVSLKNPSTTFDLMSYCGSLSDSNVWTSPWTYTNTLTELVSRPSPLSMSRLDSGISMSGSNYYLLSGLVLSTGVSTMDPVFTISKTDFSPSGGSQSPVCAQSLDVHGSLVSQQCLDLGDVDPTTDFPKSVSSYALLLPAYASVTEFVIQKGGTVLVSRTLSTGAPTVNIVWPSAGSSWSASGTYTVSWTGSDTDGDILTYSVLQSMDGGGTWTPISAAITDTQVAIESAELPGGAQSRIRVIASDGFSTGADEVVLAIANKAPDVHILSPSDNSTIIDTVLFHGDAYDIEDKSLSGLSLSWYSDRDGLIGQGTSFPAHLSAVGPHTITLTAIDSDGNMTSDSVRVFFGNRVFLPQAQR
jgi:hypothetical protein